MKAAFFNWRCVIILLALFTLQSGCSSTKTIYKKVTFQNNETDSFKKRVLLLPFMDQADLGKEKIDSITASFVTLLQKDDRILLHRSEGPVSSSLKMRSPGYGIIIDPDQAKKAEEMGMNVLLTVLVSPFEFHSKKAGIWPFRRTRKEGEISISLNALDITNGTLLLTHLESREFKLLEDLTEWEEQDEKELRRNIDEKKLNKALSGMLEDQAEALIETLKNHPWSGRILSIDQGKVIISAGKDVGVETGTIFEVYERGESIRSATGSFYFLVGSKVGELKAVTVMDSYASAVPLAETTLKAGYLIRPAKH